jgi:DNA-binding MarR family transcriptional regulator
LVRQQREATTSATLIMVRCIDRVRTTLEPAGNQQRNPNTGQRVAMVQRKPDYRGAAQLRIAMRQLTHATDLVARRHELTPKRYELILLIQAADEEGTPATVTSLRGQLLTTQGSVTQLVDAAVRAGLVERKRSPVDRRSSLLHVTPLGQQRMRKVYHDLGPERTRIADVIQQFPAIRVD